MVLSMASAFAWCSSGFDWSCSTYTCTNGTGKVEVIPYVKGNGCEDGNSWTVSTCAGAVNNEEVYYAVKVTVDADPSKDWWEKAVLTIDRSGMEQKDFTSATKEVYDALVVAGEKAKLVAGEYYFLPNRSIVKAEDFEAGATSLFEETVDVASKAKVCVKLTSENEFTTAEINGYTVSKIGDANGGKLQIKKGNDTVEVRIDADDEIKSFVVNNKEVTTYTADGSAFYVSATESLDWTCNDNGKFLKAVMDYFKLAFGTCITDDAINANFGWDDEVKACFSWNSDVQAVVNAECVVAIPKTGDASVLAWLF